MDNTAYRSSTGQRGVSRFAGFPSLAEKAARVIILCLACSEFVIFFVEVIRRCSISECKHTKIIIKLFTYKFGLIRSISPVYNEHTRVVFISVLCSLYAN
jgi:hypothetical protein